MDEVKRGSGADGLNLAEIRAKALGSLEGSQPRSIRKRGYHRALKRGEQWALTKKSWNDLLHNLVTDIYAPITNAYILTENPLLKLSGLSGWLLGEKGTIKVEYGTQYFGLDRAVLSTRLKSTPSLWHKIKSYIVNHFPSF